jgi:hypothetical protein
MMIDLAVVIRHDDAPDLFCLEIVIDQNYGQHFWLFAHAVSRRTQSESPAELLPEGVKLCVPVFPNGEPEIVANDALVGSNHLAVTGPANFVMSTTRLVTPPPPGK